MIIVRTRRRAQFEVLPHRLLRDSSLSYRSRGIACRLLSNMDGYQMSAADLARESPNEGRFAVLSALRELRERGYLKWERRRVERGRWITIVTISDTPGVAAAEVQPLHSGDSPEVQSPDSGCPNLGELEAGETPCNSTNTITNPRTTTTPETLVVPMPIAGEPQVVVGILAGLAPETQQQVLDELAGALASNNPPKRPMAWLRSVAARARVGEYSPDLALGVAAARKRRLEDAEADRVRRRAATEAEARRQDPEARARGLELARAAAAELAHTPNPTT